MVNSVLLSQDLSTINFNFSIKAGKDRLGREIVQIKEISYVHAFLNGISLGFLNHPNKTSCFEIIEYIFQIGSFSRSRIRNAVLSELKALQQKGYINPLVGKNVEYINETFIKNASQHVEISSIDHASSSSSKSPIKDSLRATQANSSSNASPGKDVVKPLPPHTSSSSTTEPLLKEPSSMIQPQQRKSQKQKTTLSEDKKRGYNWKTIKVIGSLITIFGIFGMGCLYANRRNLHTTSNLKTSPIFGPTFNRDGWCYPWDQVSLNEVVGNNTGEIDVKQEKELPSMTSLEQTEALQAQEMVDETSTLDASSQVSESLLNPSFDTKIFLSQEEGMKHFFELVTCGMRQDEEAWEYATSWLRDKTKSYAKLEEVAKFLQNGKILSEEMIQSIDFDSEEEIASIATQLVDELIDKHLNDEDEQGNTLFGKILERYVSIVSHATRHKFEQGQYEKLILKMVKNPGFKKINQPLNGDQTPFLLCSRFCADDSIVEAMISREDLENINQVDENKNSAAIYLVQRRRFKVLEKLMDKADFDPNVKSNLGENLVLIALKNLKMSGGFITSPFSEWMSKILKHSSFNCLHHPDREGNTVLFTALKNLRDMSEGDEAEKICLDIFNHDSKFHDLSNPKEPLLYKALQNHFMRLSKAFILQEEKGVDINAPYEKGNGETPFMYVIQYQLQELFDPLLERKDLDINAKDNYGATALIKTVINHLMNYGDAENNVDQVGLNEGLNPLIQRIQKFPGLEITLKEGKDVELVSQVLKHQKKADWISYERSEYSSEKYEEDLERVKKDAKSSKREAEAIMKAANMFKPT